MPLQKPTLGVVARLCKLARGPTATDESAPFTECSFTRTGGNGFVAATCFVSCNFSPRLHSSFLAGKQNIPSLGISCLPASRIHVHLVSSYLR